MLSSEQQAYFETFGFVVEFTCTMQFTNTGRVYNDAFLNSDHPRIRSMAGKRVELGFK